MKHAVPLVLLLAAAPAAAQEDPVICRPGQAQTESRLPGPKVCMPKSQWDNLKKQGLDMSADGKGTVASEKSRSLSRAACNGSGDSCY
ncbi:MAG TPA: hypothetical protein VFQ69_01095 [Rhizomicrobium sp.]|nr:hypothetical protein [Rhizomicrobium sp.]